MATAQLPPNEPMQADPMLVDTGKAGPIRILFTAVACLAIVCVVIYAAAH